MRTFVSEKEKKQDHYMQTPPTGGHPRATVPPPHPSQNPAARPMKKRMYAHDYEGRSIYMITLVVEGRQPVLGWLTGNAAAAAGSGDAPRVVPSALGVLVSSEMEHIALHYPQIRVLGRQLMPDHLHFIIFVTERLPVPLGTVINGFKAGCRRAMRELAAGVSETPTSQSDAAPNTAALSAPVSAAAPNTAAASAAVSAAAPNTAPASAAAPSAAVGVWCPAAPQQGQQGQQGLPPAWHRACPAPGVLFERGYNDRVLYGRGQLQAMIDYIRDNPRRLLAKRAAPQFFRYAMVEMPQAIPLAATLRNMLPPLPFVGSASSQQPPAFVGLLHAFGNLSLLGASRLVAVKCSRSICSDELQRLADGLLAQAREGAVVVSPFISAGERYVESRLLAARLPFVAVESRGFAPLYKPRGTRFDACCQGLLLEVSPFDYITQRVPLSRDVCHLLNAIAATLCAATDGN